MSALLGRIPSAVGYQPTLATDLGGLQERITTTTKGSITSVQVRGHTLVLQWNLLSTSLIAGAGPKAGAAVQQEPGTPSTAAAQRFM